MKKVSCVAILLSMLWVSELIAGQPFLTEDPAIIDYRKFGLIPDIDYSNSSTDTVWEAVVEIDYGAYPDIEIELGPTYLGNLPSGNGTNTYGISDTFFEFKYRFMHETHVLPEVAFTPIVYFPTGNAKRNLGNGKIWYQLQISLQKNWGDWSAYSSIGYVLNAARYMFNYPFAGLVVLKRTSPKMTWGVELYAEGQIKNTFKENVILQIGFLYQLTPKLALLASIGHSIQGERNSLGLVGFDYSV